MNKKIIIGVGVIIIALAWLIIGGVKDTAVYYLTVKEVMAGEHLKGGKGMRVSGQIVPASIHWEAQTLDLNFALAEDADTLQVYYNGIKPDQLAEAQQVVVEGKLDSSRVFVAQKILLKCPSKYEVEGQETSDRGY